MGLPPHRPDAIGPLRARLRPGGNRDACRLPAFTLGEALSGLPALPPLPGLGFFLLPDPGFEDSPGAAFCRPFGTCARGIRLACGNIGSSRGAAAEYSPG